MALNVAQPFKRAGAFPIDETLVLTKAEMKSANDNVMPSNYLAVCKDDGQLYLYDKTNDIDADTGKYRLLEGGGGSGNYDDLTNKPSLNSVTVSGDKLAIDYNLQDKMDALSVTDIEKILYLG